MLLDAELAVLYGVTTRRLNEQVRRNRKRFPDDFLFELTTEEFANLKSRFATSRWGSRRKRPFAFTEHGASNSPIACSTLGQHRATQGDRIGVNALIRWEGLGNRHRRGRGLMTSRNPALPLDSHVQSHAEVLKNKLCEFPRSPCRENDRRWLDSTRC